MYFFKLTSFCEMPFYHIFNFTFYHLGLKIG
nr:MAG TPA: hypothetical protein [Caudoviricetes sp.]